MKQGIHPKYHEQAMIHCHGCGHKFEIGSTLKETNVEVCAKCHPFFTGKHKLLDTTGRVEKFNKKYGKFLNQESK